MPYNPSSAYPRHTTYIPPIFDRGFARGFNEPNWADRFGRSMPMPGVDVRGAVEAGMAGGTKEHIGLTAEAMGRVGIMGRVQEGIRRGAQAKAARRIWNKAEYGDDPNEVAAAGAEAAEKGPGIILTQRGKIEMELGGREHSGGVNDRLSAMSQRQETTSALDDAIGNVLGGKSGGPMKIPLWRRGFSRG